MARSLIPAVAASRAAPSMAAKSMDQAPSPPRASGEGDDDAAVLLHDAKEGMVDGWHDHHTLALFGEGLEGSGYRRHHGRSHQDLVRSDLEAEPRGVPGATAP